VKRRSKRLVGIAAIALIALLITRFFVSVQVVFGHSMEPTLRSWDICLMQRVRRYEPRRGEIVMFRTADNPPLYFVKRVVALPGDVVAIEHGVIRLNGQPLDTLRLASDWELGRTNLPANRILVAADNPEFGYGIIATRLVQSRLLWYWRWKR
jgi:signal peptidase I